MKKSIKSLLFSALIVFGSTNYLNAQQIRTPAASPFSKVEQKVGLTDITIEYSRPSKKGRVIFGDLVPFDKLWRTGANMASTITFSDDVKIEGKEVKAGTYAIFTIPGKNEWKVMLNSNPKQSGTGNYKESEDVLQATVKPQTGSNDVETFTIAVNDLTTSSAKIWMLWENTMVPISVEVDVDSKVMADIKRAMDPSSEAGKYYAAASYYYDADKDMAQALEWIDKSIALGNERYWVMHLKAKIQEKKGDNKDAIKTAEKSMAMAQEAGNNDYIALNEKLIARCK